MCVPPLPGVASKVQQIIGKLKQALSILKALECLSSTFIRKFIQRLYAYAKSVINISITMHFPLLVNMVKEAEEIAIAWKTNKNTL